MELNVMTDGARELAKPKPRLEAPPGACDTHMHFYDANYPSAASAAFTPPDAGVADYQDMQARLGLQRVVIVQPSTYGRDNACQLEKRRAFGDNARLVVVVDDQTPDEELQRLTAAGACGARFFMLDGAPLPWDQLEPVAARVREHGWHIQLQMNGREFADRAGQLSRLPGTLVVDHVGRFMDPVSLDDPSFKTLLHLVEAGRCWVKLSGPYMSSLTGAPFFDDLSATVRALVDAAPERMLWASNWPHPEYQGVYDDAMLLDTLAHWVEDEAIRQRILVDNPATLYGF
jgi:D-galactarolactone isomerase